MLSTLEVRSWGLRWDQAFTMSWSRCDSNDKHESVWNSLPCLNLNYVLLLSPLSYHVSYHSDLFQSITFPRPCPAWASCQSCQQGPCQPRLSCCVSFCVHLGQAQEDLQTAIWNLAISGNPTESGGEPYILKNWSMNVSNWWLNPIKILYSH